MMKSFKRFMNNQKSKNKLNFLFIPFLILNPLFFLSYSSENNQFDDIFNEEENLIDEAKDLNPLIEEIVNKKVKKQELIQKEQIDLDDKKVDLIFKNNQIEVKNSKESIENKKDIDIISKQEDLSNYKRKNKSTNKYLSIPSDGDIYTGQFEVPLRGYVKLKEL